MEKYSQTYVQSIKIIRRLALLYTAMFVENQRWIQLHIFIILNLVALTHIVVTKPLETRFFNFQNIFNEGLCILVAYMIIPLQDAKYDSEGRFLIAYIPTYAIYALVAINMIINLFIAIKSLLKMVRNLVLKCYKLKKEKASIYVKEENEA